MSGSTTKPIEWTSGDIAALRAVAWVFACVFAFIVLVAFNLLWGWWAKGHAISAWVHAKHHVEIPWYEAGYLPIDAKDFAVSVSGLNAESKTGEAPQ